MIINKQANNPRECDENQVLSRVFSAWALTGKEIKRASEGVNSKWLSLHGGVAVKPHN